MKCPNCGKNWKVVDSRDGGSVNTWWRRRVCLHCGTEGVSYEKVAVTGRVRPPKFLRKKYVSSEN